MKNLIRKVILLLPICFLSFNITAQESPFVGDCNGFWNYLNSKGKECGHTKQAYRVSSKYYTPKKYKGEVVVATFTIKIYPSKITVWEWEDGKSKCPGAYDKHFNDCAAHEQRHADAPKKAAELVGGTTIKESFQAENKVELEETIENRRKKLELDFEANLKSINDEIDIQTFPYFCNECKPKNCLTGDCDTCKCDDLPAAEFFYCGEQPQCLDNNGGNDFCLDDMNVVCGRTYYKAVGNSWRLWKIDHLTKKCTIVEGSTSDNAGSKWAGGWATKFDPGEDIYKIENNVQDINFQCKDKEGNIIPCCNK